MSLIEWDDDRVTKDAILQAQPDPRARARELTQAASPGLANLTGDTITLEGRVFKVIERLSNGEARLSNPDNPTQTFRLRRRRR